VNEKRKGQKGLNLKAATRLALLFAVLTFSVSARASFEPLPVGARAAGMGEAYTVVADDTLSLYYNPAGIIHVRRPELGTSYSRLFFGLDDKSEISRSFLGYAQPLPHNWGAAGISYLHLGLSGLYSEDTIGLSFAREVQDKWNVGGSLKLLRKSFGSDQYTDNAINVETGQALNAKDPLLAKGNSKSAVGLDLGAQYRLSKNYAFGLALRNINQPNTALNGSDKAPAVYALGISRWNRVSSLSLELANWKFANDQDYRLNFGGERWFRSGFGARAGLAFGSRQFANLSLGGSYRMDGFQFDYALHYPLQGVEKTAGTHMVSLSYRFGKPEPDPVEAQLNSEREARLRAEAELARLRQQLMELTTEKPVAAPATDVVDKAAQEALKQAEEEIQRLKSQPQPVSAAPVETPAPAPTAVAPTAPVAPKPVAPPPAKPRVSPDLLAQYSDALKFYSQQTKSGAPLEERIATLQRTIDKYEGKGLDISSVYTELKKLKGEDTKTSDDYKLAVSYYNRIVQQGGTSAEERILLLERIVKKYKPMGVNTSDIEKELETLKKKR